MPDHLEEQEVIDRVRTWWRENGVSLVGSLVLVVAGWSGWNWYSAYSTERAEQAFADFSEYVTLRESGERESERALELLAALDERHEGSSPQYLSLLYRAADSVEDEDADSAMGFLMKIVEASPRGQIEDLARVRLSRLYLERDEPELALDLLDQIEGSGFAPIREELRGDAHRLAGHPVLAREAYEAALESDQQFGVADRWPFLQMKIFGLDFGPGAEAEAESSDSPQSASEIEPAYEQANQTQLDQIEQKPEVDEGSSVPSNTEKETAETLSEEMEAS